MQLILSHFTTAYKIVHTNSSVYFILNTKKGLNKYRSFVQYNDDVVRVVVVVQELYLQ
jgi:hypothetical protein